MRKEKFNSQKCQTIPNQICVTAYLLGKRRCRTRTALIYSGLFKWQQNYISQVYCSYYLFVFHFKMSTWLESEFSAGETLKKWGVQSQGVCHSFVPSPRKKASIVVSSNLHDTKSKSVWKVIGHWKGVQPVTVFCAISSAAKTTN